MNPPNGPAERATPGIGVENVGEAIMSLHDVKQILCVYEVCVTLSCAIQRLSGKPGSRYGPPCVTAGRMKPSKRRLASLDCEGITEEEEEIGFTRT